MEQLLCTLRCQKRCFRNRVVAFELFASPVIISGSGRQLAQLVYGRDINHVLLLHLGAFSSTILPDALDLVEKKGFKLVTLEEAENDPVYQGDPDVGSKYGGTMLELWMDAKKIKLPHTMEKPYKELEEICR